MIANILQKTLTFAITKLLTEKLIISVVLEILESLTKSSKNKLDDRILEEIKKALK